MQASFEKEMLHGRTVAFVSIFLILAAHGFLRIHENTDHLRLHLGTPIENLDDYRAVKPLLQGVAVVSVVADGDKEERARKHYGAQYALCPSAVKPWGFPPHPDIVQELARGLPVLCDLDDPEHRTRFRKGLEALARAEGFSIRRIACGPRFELFLREKGP